jgi:hypothetical protein
MAHIMPLPSGVRCFYVKAEPHSAYLKTYIRSDSSNLAITDRFMPLISVG